jgi:uncharacterized membrane protein YkoI
LIVAIVAASSMAAWAADKARAPKELSGEQAIACIKHALGAKPGNLRELEVKIENSRTVCEVEVVDASGKKFEVYVDVAANKVLRVED